MENITQRFSPRSDSSEPHVRVHSLGIEGGVQALGGGVPRAFDFDSQRGLSPQ